MRVTQQQPAAPDAAKMASEAAKYRGVIEVKRNAPKHNVHGEHYGDGFLELPDVTDFVLPGDEIQEGQKERRASPKQHVNEEHRHDQVQGAPGISEERRGDAPANELTVQESDGVREQLRHKDVIESMMKQTKFRVRTGSNRVAAKMARTSMEGAVAVLEDGDWRLVRPPTAGSQAGENTDFKDSSAFQNLNLTGTAMSHDSPPDSLKRFRIDGLADHQLLDIFSTTSQRLAPQLGFADDHPSIVESRQGREASAASLPSGSVGNAKSPRTKAQTASGMVGEGSVTTYGSLLELVEAELDLPPSQPAPRDSKSSSSLFKGTRGILAPPEPVKKKRKKRKKGKKGAKSAADSGTVDTGHASAVQEAAPFPKQEASSAFVPNSPSMFDEPSISSAEGQRHGAETTKIFAEFKVRARTDAMKADPKRQRLSDISLAIFAQNIQQLLSIKDTFNKEEERHAWERGFSRPPIVVDRANLTSALHSSSQSRREMRAYVKAGLQLLNEEKYKHEGDRSTMTVAGASMPIAGKPERIDIRADDRSSLDWDEAFVSFDASHVYREKGRDVYTAPKSRNKATELSQKKILESIAAGESIDPAVQREKALNDEGATMPTVGYDLITDAPTHKEKYYDGTKQYPASPQRSQDGQRTMSPSRSQRLKDLQNVYMHMMDDDDDALEIAYATVLGLAKASDFTSPNDDHGPIDDELTDEEEEEEEEEGVAASVSFVSIRSAPRSETVSHHAGVMSDSVGVGHNSEDASAVQAQTSLTHRVETPHMQMQIEIPTSPIRPSHAGTGGVSGSGINGEGESLNTSTAWLDDPRVPRASSVALSTPQAHRPPRTPILSMDEYKHSVPPPHVLERQKIEQGRDKKRELALLLKSESQRHITQDTASLELTGSNALGSDGPSGESKAYSPTSLKLKPQPTPLVLDTLIAGRGFRVDSDRGQEEALSSDSLSVKADAMSLQRPTQLSISREPSISSVQDPVPLNPMSYSTSALPIAKGDIAGAAQKNARKTNTMSMSMDLPRQKKRAAAEAQMAMGDDYEWLGDDEEAAMEEELRGMLQSGGSRTGATTASLGRPSISYSGIEREREFLSQTHGIQHSRRGGKKKKNRLGGGKLLPPLQPASPRLSQVGDALSVQREKVAGSTGLPVEERATRKKKSKNKFIRDADFDTPRSQEQLQQKSRARTFGGRDLLSSGKEVPSDALSQSIDEQLLAMASNEVPFASRRDMYDEDYEEYNASLNNMPPLGIRSNSETDPTKGRYVNMNMSIRMPSTGDVSQLAENELGLGSARQELD